MRSLVQWEDPGLPEKDGIKSTVYELDFSRDGNLLVVGCRNLVLVYDIKEGDLLHRLKGHKETVYSVAFQRDGQRFASGGADSTVIIWTVKGEGVVKYKHNSSIQKVRVYPRKRERKGEGRERERGHGKEWVVISVMRLSTGCCGVSLQEERKTPHQQDSG